jgi:hypothetical protein
MVKIILFFYALALFFNFLASNQIDGISEINTFENKVFIILFYFIKNI